jgi:hypothetical protein
VGVGDERVGHPDRHGLDRPVVAPARALPLRTLPLEPVDVHRCGYPPKAQQGHERRVRGIEDDRRVHGPALDEEVGHGQRGVAQRLERLAARSRQVHELHPEIAAHARILGSSAVHDDLVTLGHEALSDLLDRRLETAVPRRNTTCTDHGDAHVKAASPRQP